MLEAGGRDSFLEHALALEYTKVGDNIRAITLFEDLLKREPGYVGSYYHLGKLYAASSNLPKAVETFELGIAQARKANDNHSRNELQMALEEITED
jgi:tetratricopeptide (TPR) repeat protein